MKTNPWQVMLRAQPDRRGRFLTATQRLQRRILIGHARREYLFLAALGLLPLGVAWVIGAHRGIEAMPGSWAAKHTNSLKGYWDSHWVLYPVMLPLALYLLRWLMRPLFGYGDEGRGQNPLGDGRYKYFQIAVRDLLVDARVLHWTLGLCVGLHVVDTAEVLPRFLFDSPPATPKELDWCWFDTATIGPDAVSKLGQFMLIVSAYLNQFAIAFIAILIVVMLFRYNRQLTTAIYHKCPDKPPHEGYVLQLDSESDGRFGLSGLDVLFDRQILILGAMAAYVLWSRYSNVEIEPADVLDSILPLAALVANALDSDRLPTVALTWDMIVRLFHDAGQAILVICWALVAVVVLTSSRIKLIPLGCLRCPKNAFEYVRVFVPDAVGSNPEPDEELVDRFARQDFWPCGDYRAAACFALVFFIAFWMVFPLGAKDGITSKLIAGALLFAAFSILSTACVFLFHKHRLRWIASALVTGIEK